MGRRGVQQLSPAEWREALEQQIREEQQRRKDGSPEAPQKRSQSAPQQEKVHVLGPVRATTATGGENSPVVKGRRRYQHQQSEEEYRKGLQDQIEEKKRLAQEKVEKERSERRNGSRSKEEDAAVGRTEERVIDSEAGTPSVKSLGLQRRLEDAKMTASSNQHDAEPCQIPVVKAEVAADPEAITKIVDFCEELKKQNEDVKRQLLEQHAVLSSLHSTLAEGKDGKASAVGSQRRNGELNAKDTRVTSSIKKLEAKGPEAKSAATLQVAPRPRPMRGETKIPLPGKRLLSSLRSAGAGIVMGLSPQHSPKLLSPVKRAEAKLDPGGHRGSSSSGERAMVIESPHKSSSKTSQVKDIGSGSRSTTCQDPQHGVPESEPKDEDSPTSSGEEIDTKSTGDLNESSVYVKVQEDIGDELPMDTESKLVHNWETDGELLNCTSISILDGTSSLIPLNRSLSKLF